MGFLLDCAGPIVGVKGRGKGGGGKSYSNGRDKNRVPPDVTRSAP